MAIMAASWESPDETEEETARLHSAGQMLVITITDHNAAAINSRDLVHPGEMTGRTADLRAEGWSVGSCPGLCVPSIEWLPSPLGCEGARTPCPLMRLP